MWSCLKARASSHARAIKISDGQGFKNLRTRHPKIHHHALLVTLLCGCVMRGAATNRAVMKVNHVVAPDVGFCVFL